MSTPPHFLLAAGGDAHKPLSLVGLQPPAHPARRATDNRPAMQRGGPGQKRNQSRPGRKDPSGVPPEPYQGTPVIRPQTVKTVNAGGYGLGASR